MEANTAASGINFPEFARPNSLLGFEGSMQAEGICLRAETSCSHSKIPACENHVVVILLFFSEILSTYDYTELYISLCPFDKVNSDS